MNDIDVYKFNVQQDSPLAFQVIPVAGLDVHVRLFQADGVTEVPLDNATGGVAGVTEFGFVATLPSGVYYVGISSEGNNTYNAKLATGAAGGVTTGGYSLRVGFNSLPTTTLDDTASFDNSSFSNPTLVGIIGIAGQLLTNANIGPNPNLAQQYSIQLPGAGDAPGERNIPFQAHINTVPGQLPDATAGIPTLTYDFQTEYGFSPAGDPYSNVIKPEQRQRTREAMELYSRYLGVQFREVTPGQIADMTIATGDPHAIAPTISSGTGNDNDGVNSISGVPSIVSTSDVSGIRTSVTGTVLATTDYFNAAVSNRRQIDITSAAHGLTTGQFVEIRGATGTTAANGAWKVTVIDENNFVLNGSTWNGAYAGGGTWTLLNVSARPGGGQFPRRLGRQPIRRGVFQDGDEWNRPSAGPGRQFRSTGADHHGGQSDAVAGG